MAKRRKPAKTKSRRTTRGVSSRKPGQDKGRIVPGPRKERLKTKLGRISRNHKRRSIWFQARAAWPLREAPVQALVRERDRVESTLAPAPGIAQWENIGPTNIGGRITSLVCDPAKPDSLWVVRLAEASGKALMLDAPGKVSGIIRAFLMSAR